MKKKRPIENFWCDCLINYIPKPIRKTGGGFKNKVVRIFKTSRTEEYGKQTVHGRGKKPNN